MAKKTIFGNLLRPTSSVQPSLEDEETQAQVDRLTRELAGREIDARFREALRRGETQGDVVILDEHGNEIKDALSRKTIFDF